jgi:hypothetical protein
MAAQSSRTPVLIAGIVLALGGIVGLNMLQERNDPKYQERMEKERQREEAKKAQEQAAKSPAQGGGLTEQDPANSLATFGAEKTLGQPNAKASVTVGWRWTPQVQADPRLVYGAIDALQKAAPSASIRVVNLDAKPGAVPEGVTVNGSTIVPAGPDGRIVAEAVGTAVPSILQSSAASSGGGTAVATPAGPPSAAAPAPAAP